MGKPPIVERLLAVESSPTSYANEPTTCWHRNPDGPEAAETISTLMDFVQRLECECDSYHGVTCGRCQTLAKVQP